jgi:nicotinamide mononucleotide transporter
VNDFIIGVKEGIIATSMLEWIAVLTGVAYVILAAKKYILCWLFALISAGIYVYLCYSSDLFLESFLQLFYVLMAIMGWYLWKKSEDREDLIITWSRDFHFFNIAVSTVIVVGLGYYFDGNTNQDYPYLDAFTTVFSMAATYMVTQRVLENWIYWIVVDIAAIFLYAGKGFFLTSVLYLIFTVLALYGFVKWRKQYRLQLNDKSRNHRPRMFR